MTTDGTFNKGEYDPFTVEPLQNFGIPLKGVQAAERRTIYTEDPQRDGGSNADSTLDQLCLSRRSSLAIVFSKPQ